MRTIITIEGITPDAVTIMADEPMLTVAEAQVALGVSRQTLSNWEKQGRVHPRKDGYHGKKYTVREIQELKNARR